MGRWRSVGRTGFAGVIRSAGLAAVLATAAARVEAQSLGRTETWHAVVDADRVNIHSGRAEQFEKIGTLKRGDVVLVRSVNTFGWAAIAPPPGLHGFVAQQEVAEGSEAGTVRAIGRVPVLYPISDDPAQCFRKYRVAPDTKMMVLGQAPTPDKGLFLKVEMPEQVDVYVLAQFLRKATSEEVAAWNKRQADLRKSAEDAPAEQPLIEIIPATPRVEPRVEPQAPPTAPAEQPASQTPPPTAAQMPAEQPREDQPPAGPAQQQTPPTEPTSPETAPAEPDHPAGESQKPVEVTLAGLEQLYAELTRVPIADAEIEPLLKSYQAFAASTTKEGERRVAGIRIELLKVRLDHQAALRRLAAAAKTAGGPPDERPVEVWTDAQGRPVFAAQGTLISSNVFDGRRLPLLYRIQDPITGRTVAYVRAAGEQRLELERRLNLRVGVVGKAVHDPGLRIDVIEVARLVDLEEGE